MVKSTRFKPDTCPSYLPPPLQFSPSPSPRRLSMVRTQSWAANLYFGNPHPPIQPAWQPRSCPPRMPRGRGLMSTWDSARRQAPDSSPPRLGQIFAAKSVWRSLPTGSSIHARTASGCEPWSRCACVLSPPPGDRSRVTAYPRLVCLVECRVGTVATIDGTNECLGISGRFGFHKESLYGFHNVDIARGTKNGK
jgi:hypothetical protein